MPELPEIETVKLQLQKYLVGQKLVELERLHPKSVQGDIVLVQSKKVTGVRRFGKMLVIDLAGRRLPRLRQTADPRNDESALHLAIHFKMSGQLILVKSDKRKAISKERNLGSALKNRIVGGHPTEDWLGKLPSKHTRAIFHFSSGDTMNFNDQRIFGWVKIVSSSQLAEDSYIKNLGPEPWDITDGQFYEKVHKRKKPIKILLMDQNVISGVGNIYANDGLGEARISPETSAAALTLEQTSVLRKGLIKVLKEGIKYGGATASDAKYIDLQGLGGHYQEHFRTYDRTGEKCLRSDGGIIKKTVLGGRGTYFCPKCQKL